MASVTTKTNKMSRRGVSAPLAVQMENLKKSMSSRDQRRNQERMQRVVGNPCPSNPCGTGNQLRLLIS